MRNALPQRPLSVSQIAFTLVEMLVVIAVVGILASLLLPALARSQDRGRQTVCRNELRQLAIGFTLYHSDADDRFPAPGSATRYGPQPEDWIWWHYGRNISNSSIAVYINGFNAKLFTCPADRDAQRMQKQGLLPNDPYRYSYSLTSYDLDGDRNPGMASIITQDRKVFAFRQSQINRPVQKIMLVEEDRATIDDSRWVPMGAKTNLISSRHGGRGNIVFADTHIESVLPLFGMNPTNSMPRF